MGLATSLCGIVSLKKIITGAFIGNVKKIVNITIKLAYQNINGASAVSTEAESYALNKSLWRLLIRFISSIQK